MDQAFARLMDPDTPIAIVGPGYVGLPLAVEFAKHRAVIGFDINQGRIAELKAGRDSTRETSPEDLAAARHLTYAGDLEPLRPCRIFIVPAPVDTSPLATPPPTRYSTAAVHRLNRSPRAHTPKTTG